MRYYHCIALGIVLGHFLVSPVTLAESFRPLGYVEKQPALQEFPGAGLLRPHDPYPEYWRTVSPLIEGLLQVKARANLQNRAYRLQELAALTQALSLKNSEFRQKIAEKDDDVETFETYQLVQKAVTALEDAVLYWRNADRSRLLYRGGATAKADDDEILQVKLQTAFFAIEELEQYHKTHQILQQKLGP